MHCTKCEGLMVPDDLIDMQESSIPMWMKGWRCVSCGNIIDQLIQQHRDLRDSWSKVKSLSPSISRTDKVPA
ncbi:protein of unknown function [Nitrospira japonica]|uniref:Uncharacterized protein n=1 Tax=Nitrospira japonica TaxID=1325564 RepID=A0A1W1I000_9BACT|nr:protein of unknown function [Nitrospira japonica]